MKKFYVLVMISLACRMLYGQENVVLKSDTGDSLELLRTRISSYEQYYNKMVRLADEGSSGMSMLSLYQINGRPLGRAFLKSEIDASNKESPQALVLFKKANACNVSSSVLSCSGAIIGPVGLLMMFVSIFSQDSHTLGMGLALSGVGLTATLIAIPISTAGIKARRNGYLQYDKDLRHKYNVPNSIVIEDEE